MRSALSHAAIVVPSCDKYSDVWPALFGGLKIHWSDCPLPIYLISNHVAADRAGVTPILVGKDAPWSQNLIGALDAIPYEYVLLFLDDLVLARAIDNDRVCGLIARCVLEDWNYLRFNPTPAPPNDIPNAEEVASVPAGDWYRSSTILALWKTRVLKAVLNPKETAWEFEIFGSSRTDDYDRWFACKHWNLPYHNLVIKGKLEPRALRRVRSMGIKLDPRRPVMNPAERFLLRLKRARSFMMNFVPRRARRTIRSLFAPS